MQIPTKIDRNEAAMILLRRARELHDSCATLRSSFDMTEISIGELVDRRSRMSKGLNAVAEWLLYDHE